MSFLTRSILTSLKWWINYLGLSMWGCVNLFHRFFCVSNCQASPRQKKQMFMLENKGIYFLSNENMKQSLVDELLFLQLHKKI